MSVFDKMLDVMKLDDEDEEYDDDYYDEDDEDEEPRQKHSFLSRKHHDEDDGSQDLPAAREESRPVKHASKITPMRSRKSNTMINNLEVCVIKPTQFEDSKEIVDTLLTDRLVIVNIEGLDLGLAQRIIDVTSGACLAVDGTLQKISNYIFLVSPANVDISGDLQGIMDAYDVSGVQAGFNT